MPINKRLVKLCALLAILPASISCLPLPQDAAHSPSAPSNQQADLQRARSNWIRSVSNKIEPNWFRPETEKTENYPCKATIRIIPGGEVIYVRFQNPCSADGSIEKSIETAIYKSSPLPFDPSVFSRTIVISFSPQAQK